LSDSWLQLRAEYPTAQTIYVIVDNWPVHFHTDALARLQPQDSPWLPYVSPHWPKEPSNKAIQDDWSIQLLCLPTYASLLNPIEKLWRWLKQDVLHMHHCSYDWQHLNLLASTFLDQFQFGSDDLLHYHTNDIIWLMQKVKKNMLKAVIFDVGGVLIRTQSRAGREKWAAKFNMDSWDFENFVFRSESGRQAELGQKSVKAHWQWLGQHFGLDEAELIEMRRDFFAGDILNQPLVEHVKRLRQAGYRTGLLSNFGDSARRVWTEVYPFISHFEGIVISAEVGLAKPNPKIYHLAAESVGVKVEEALFIDDFIENIEAARQVGMQTIHFTDPQIAQQQLAEITGVK